MGPYGFGPDDTDQVPLKLVPGWPLSMMTSPGAVDGDITWMLPPRERT
jgi:hypothetical protein